MPWSRDNHIGTLIADVLALQARAHRLQLLRQVEAARAQARAAGVPDAPLAQLKAQVLGYPLPEVERASFVPTVSPVPAGLQHLTVHPSEDNGF